jgi:hypothetical protein
VTGLDVAGSDILLTDSRMQMRAVAQLSDGSVRDVTTTTTWSVSPPGAATPCTQKVDARPSISNDGIVATAGRGEGSVIAHYGDFRAIKQILVVPRNTFRLSGVVTAGDVPGRLLSDVALEVIEGIGTGQKWTTAEDGCYVLYGLSGIVTIRMTRHDYPVQETTTGVPSQTTHEIQMWPAGYPW